jgi:acyl carrier protein
MSPNHLRARIIEVVSAVFRIAADEVAGGLSPDRISGWDSAKHVELVVALEDRFGCLFDPEEVPELTSLERMETILSRHAQASRP